MSRSGGDVLNADEFVVVNLLLLAQVVSKLAQPLPRHYHRVLIALSLILEYHTPNTNETNRLLQYYFFAPILISLSVFFVLGTYGARSNQGPASQNYSLDHLWIYSS